MDLRAHDHALPAGEGITLLHRMDSVAGDAVVVSTDRARLASASFLDGRETFWDEQRLVPLRLVCGGAPARRFVFHVGFCGSTLLARLLDAPGRVLALKEPQCLADIAGQRAAIVEGRALAPLESLIDHALACLGATGEPEIAVVVKPTNWVNSLLPQLCAPGRIERAVFVSMDRRAYLGAVFRGGRPRLEFCTRLAAEVAAVAPGANALLAEAIERDGEPLDRGARIAALLHALQEWLFARAMDANGWSAAARIDFAELVQHPIAVLCRARQTLGLDAVDDDPERPFRLMERHTKDPSSVFRPRTRRREDSEIERHHGKRFDAALDWLGRHGHEFA